ncbi:MAG: 2-C-methyl-D-erythritol 4-phosphate cytidylyltransferase [Bacteroidota bacterium]
MPEKYVIITAGGVGTRMGSSIPKQFMELHNMPVILHSMKAFLNYSDSVKLILVLADELIGDWESLCTKYNIAEMHQVVAGGDTRFQSVKNGLELLGDHGLVAIHDAARPLVSPSLIEQCFREAEIQGNAVPVVPLKDSIREVREGDNRPVDRGAFRLMQTPQVFKSTIIKKAYDQAYRPSFTDDATVAESIGVRINLLAGEEINIKITTREDMLIAESLFKSVN